MSFAEVVASGPEVNATTGALTVAWPAGHQVGDVGLLFVNSSAGGTTETLSTAAGFTLIATATTGSGTAGSKVSAYWCRATSTAQASPVVTAGTDYKQGVIVTLRGAVPTGTPVEASVTSVKATTSTTFTTPAVTTTEPLETVVTVIAKDTDSAGNFVGAASTYGNHRGAQLQFHSGTVSGLGGGMAVASSHGPSTPGSTGSIVAALTATAINSMIAFAVKGTPDGAVYQFYDPFDLATDDDIYVPIDASVSDSINGGFSSSTWYDWWKATGTLTDPAEVRRDVTGLTIGRSYTVRGEFAGFTNPGTVQIGTVELGLGTATAVPAASTNTTAKITHTFTATATTHTLRFIADNSTFDTDMYAVEIFMTYSAVPTYITSAAASLSSNLILSTVPAGYTTHIPGDVYVIIATLDAGQDLTSWAGWEVVYNQLQAGMGRTVVLWRPILSDPDVPPAANIGISATAQMSYQKLIIRTARTVNPFDVAIASASDGAVADTTPTAPSLTPATKPTLFLVGFAGLFAASADTVTFSTPAGMTLVQLVRPTAAGTAGRVWVVDRKAVADLAATGTQVSTVSVSAPTSAVSVLLRSADTPAIGTVTGTAPGSAGSSGAASRVQFTTGTVAASAASSGAAVRVQLVTGNAAAAVASSGTALAVGVATGTAPATAASTGTSQAIRVATGTAPAAAGSSGTAALVAAASGTVAGSASSSGVALVVRVAVGTAAASAGSSGTAQAVLIATGTASATATSVEGGVSGTVSATAGSSGVASVVRVASGTAAVAAVSAGAALAVRVATGVAPAAAASSGAAVRVHVTTVTVGAVAGSSGPALAVRVATGSAAAVAASQGVGSVVAAATGTIASVAASQGAAVAILGVTGTAAALVVGSGTAVAVVLVTGTWAGSVGSFGDATVTAGDIVVVGSLDPRRWVAELGARSKVGVLAEQRWVGEFRRARAGSLDEQRWKGTLL